MSKLPVNRRNVLKIIGGGSISAALVDSTAGEEAATVVDRTIYTDEDGSFGVDLPPGTYEVTATKDGYETRTREVTVEENETQPLDITLPSQDSVTIYTDEDGSFGVDLPPGTYEVTATKDDFETRTREVTVEENETQPLDITLPPQDTPTDAIENALDEYENAAIQLFESELEAQARLTAGLFDEHGQEFADELVSYWGYKAGIIDEDQIDEELKEVTDSMLEELDEDDVLDNGSEDYATPMYWFFDDLFDALDRVDDFEEIRTTTVDFFFGDHSDQSHELQIDGATPSELKADLLDEFDEERDEIKNLLTKHAPPGDVRDRIADEIRASARQSRREASDLIDQANEEIERLRGDPEEAIEFELSMPEAEEPQLPDLAAELDADLNSTDGLRSQAVLGGVGIVGAGILAGKLAGKYGLGKWSLGTVSLKGAAVTVLKLLQFCVKYLIKKLILLTKKLVAKFKAKFKEEIVENVTRWARTLVERHLIIGTGVAQAEITAFSTPNITEDDEVEKPLIPSFDNFWEDLISVLPFFGPSAVGRQTGKITIQNTGNVRIAPEIDLAVSGRDNGWRLLPGTTQIDYGGEVPWLAPEEERTYTFDYELVMDAFSEGEAAVSVYDFFLTEEEPFDAESNRFDVAEEGGWFSGILSDGVLDSAGSVLEGYTVGMFGDEAVGTEAATENDEPARATIDVTYPQSHIDLHVYDEDDNHVGYDYEAEQVVVEIPGAEHSGRDRGTDGREWVHLEELDDEYEIELIGSDAAGGNIDEVSAGGGERDNVVVSAAKGEDIPYSVEVTEELEQPAELGTLASTVGVGGGEGETVSTTIGFEEIGGDNELSDLSVIATDLSHIEEEKQIDVSQIITAPEQLTIEPGGQEFLTVTVEIPADQKEGVYKGDLIIEDSSDATLSVIDFELTVKGDGPTAFVTGDVVDTDNEAVSDAVIEAVDLQTDTVEATTESGSDGSFTVEVPIGNEYELTASASGFEPGLTEVTVEEADWTYDADIVLVPIDDGASITDYANEDGIVDISGLRDAIDDWRTNDIEIDLLRDVIGAWRSDETVE